MTNKSLLAASVCVEKYNPFYPHIMAEWNHGSSHYRAIQTLSDTIVIELLNGVDAMGHQRWLHRKTIGKNSQQLTFLLLAELRGERLE